MNETAASIMPSPSDLIGPSMLTLSCLPIYPMPSLKVFYQNMDYYDELNIYQKVLNEFRPNFAETW